MKDRRPTMPRNPARADGRPAEQLPVWRQTQNRCPLPYFYSQTP